MEATIDVSSGAFSCSLCGECQRKLQRAAPGLWTVRPRENVLVACFPTAWQPGPCVLAPPPLPAAQAALPDAPAPAALGSPMEAPRDPGTASRLLVRWPCSEAQRSSGAEMLRAVPEHWYAAECDCSPLRDLVSAVEHASNAQAALMRGAIAAAAALFETPDCARRVGLLCKGVTTPEFKAPHHELVRELQTLCRQKQGWSFAHVCLLAALPLHAEDERGLAHLLTAAASTDHSRAPESRRVLLAWLSGPGDKRFPDFSVDRARAALRCASSREELLRFLRQARGDLRAALQCLFAIFAGGGQPLKNPRDPACWNAAALVKWQHQTVAWAGAERLRLLEQAARRPAWQVLQLLGDGAELFEQALHPDRAESAQPCPLLPSLGTRSVEQLLPPTPGEARWYDAHEQPEHQALLLAHNLRELLSKLVGVAAATAPGAPVRLLRSADEAASMLRGDLEYLTLEGHHLPRTLPAELLRLLLASSTTEEVAVRDALANGSASTTRFTGRCLPRRCRWVA